jgi:hypothetical protein
MGKIRPGDLVIMNSFDRPCCRLIAYVTSIVGEEIQAKYLTNGVKQVTVRGEVDQVTRVADFGVSVVLTREYITTARNPDLPQIATYSDGMPRAWQPEIEEKESFGLKRNKMNKQGLINHYFVPFPCAIWDHNIDVSLAEFRLLGYILHLTHELKKTTKIRLSDEQLMNGRKRQVGIRVDTGCGLKNRASIRAARTALIKKSWIEYEENTDDPARPIKFYSITEQFLQLFVA